MARYDKKMKTWTADIMLNNKRYRKKGFLEKKYAEIWESQKRYDEEKISVGLMERSSIKDVQALINLYLENLEGKSENYIKREKQRSVHWLRFFQENHIFEIKNLSKNTALKYKHWRAKQVTQYGDLVKPRTLNDELSFIKKVFEWAVKVGELEENLFSYVPKIAVEEKEVSYLSEEQIKLLLDRLEKYNKPLKDIVVIFLGTGMRLGELISLKVSNIHLEKKTINLDLKNTKKRYSRIIPLQSKAFDILSSYCKEKEQDDIVFTTKSGKKIDDANLGRSFSKHCKKVGIQYSFHDLRRTYISHMIMAGIEPIRVMGIVGHKNFSAMKPYLHLSPKYLGKELDVLPF